MSVASRASASSASEQEAIIELHSFFQAEIGHELAQSGIEVSRFVGVGPTEDAGTQLRERGHQRRQGADRVGDALEAAEETECRQHQLVRQPEAGADGGAQGAVVGRCAVRDLPRPAPLGGRGWRPDSRGRQGGR